MWTKGKLKRKKKQNRTIHQQLFEDTKGFLDEKAAQRWIVKFFRSNVGTAIHHTMGVELFPFQEMIIKTMLQKDYTLGILSRGIGKSYSTAIFAGLQAILSPNCKIAVISKSFRQSRLLFQTLEDISNKEEAGLLAECMNGKPSHANDEWTMKFDNGSMIKALPLGSGDKLRGFRFNVIIIDELLLMPEKILNEVILPFLSTNADTSRRVKMEKVYDDALEKGIISLEDYEDIKQSNPLFKNNKMVGLSSASYQFEHLYKIYKDYVNKIMIGTKDGAPLAKDRSNELKGSYAVFQMSYDVAPKGLYNENLIEKSKSEMSAAQFAREFGSQFSDASSGFFSIKTMEECTAKEGAYPCTLLSGRKGKKYILAIDPNASESDDSDYFAMIVMQIEDEGRCTLVHSYGVAGLKYGEHIKYFHYLMKHFSPEMVVMDNAGGVQFLRACQESKTFKDDNIKLESIVDCDLNVTGGEAEQDQLQKFKEEYDKSKGKIVYFQKFGSEWIRNSNEYLQFCIDGRNICFSSDLNLIEKEYHVAKNIDIDIENLKFTSQENIDIYGNKIEDDYDKFDNKKARMAKQIDLMEHQHFLIKLTKEQISSIEPRISDSGNTMQFVMPKELKNKKGADRPRRDLYTAVLMGNWVVKKFADAMKIKDDPEPDWTPVIF